jgi:hypothetical protein
MERRLAAACALLALLVPASALAAPHRYWRIHTTATAYPSAPGQLVMLSEVELRATRGGADQTSLDTGTATASSLYAGSLASYAFDNNDPTATTWTSALGGADVGAWWLQYDAGAGNTIDVAQVAITAPYTAGTEAAAPRDFSIRYSDNGTSWSTAASVTGTTWTTSQTRTFDVPVTWTNAISESATAADGLVHAARLGEAASEATTPSDAAPLSTTLPNAIDAGSVATADSFANAATFVEARTESTSAGDVLTPARTSPATASETVSLGDGLPAASTLAGAVAEALSAGEGLADQLTHEAGGTAYSDAIAEMASPSEALGHAAALSSFAVELAAGTDALATGATFPIAVAEAASSGDVAEASRLVAFSWSEVVAVEGLISVARTTSGVVFEQAAATERASAGVAYVDLVLEAALLDASLRGTGREVLFLSTSGLSRPMLRHELVRTPIDVQLYRPILASRLTQER